MIKTSKKDDVSLQKVPCVYYLIQFKKKEVQALIDSESEVNAMTPTYASRLSFWVYCTDIRAQKLDGSLFETFGMILASFLVEDKLERTRFF